MNEWGVTHTDANIPAIYGEAIAGQAAKVQEKLLALVKTIDKSTFDVAELLFEVRDKKYYHSFGYENFKEYVSQTLKLKTSKAYYLTRIVEVMKILGVDRETYEPIGVVKLRDIVSLNLAEKHDGKEMGEHIRELIEAAPDMTAEEIKTKVKELKGQVGENEVIWMHFGVTESSKQNVITPAIELAKANIGTIGTDSDGMAVDASDGRALEVICVEYLNDPQNKPAIMQDWEDEGNIITDDVVDGD